MAYTKTSPSRISITILLSLPFVVVFSSAFVTLPCTSYTSTGSYSSIGINSSQISKSRNRTYPNIIENKKLEMSWNLISDPDKCSVPSSAVWSEEQYQSALSFYDALHSCQDKYLKHMLHDALKCLEGAYRLYGPENVIGSFNGGKDAVVILHLMRAAHAQHYRQKLSQGESVRIVAPRVLYFENKDEFPEVLQLLKETVDNFELDMVAFSQDNFSFASGLQVLVNNSSLCLAFVLGTRTSDPNAKGQGQFSPSSDWMPPFMRVNPVLDWSYGHVWHFLRKFNLPYCSLYDDGYTSLGSVHDTLPCPALEKPNQDGFWPAYMLSDWSQERAGRLDKKNTKKEIKVACTTHHSLSEVDVDSVSCSSVSSSSVGDSAGIQRTVGLIIIGDEILKGQTSDTNTNAAAIAFRTNGVPLDRVVVVPDELDVIVAEINRMQKEVDIIVTSGGVGPTHDDVTIVSVSTALKSPLVLHQGMASLLREKMEGKDANSKNDGILSEAQVKMATLPACSKLRYFAGKDEWPILQCQNIYILPGVPQFFSKKIDILAPHLSEPNNFNCVSSKIVLSVDEVTVVPMLNKVVKDHPHVSIGSYPFIDHPEFSTVVTLEAHECEGPTRSARRRLSSFKVPIPSDTETRSAENNTDNLDCEPSTHFSREEMDLNLKLAISDLINSLPENSVIRVDTNNDQLR